jgi:hypothetical protein
MRGYIARQCERCHHSSRYRITAGAIPINQRASSARSGNINRLLSVSDWQASGGGSFVVLRRTRIVVLSSRASRTLNDLLSGAHVRLETAPNLDEFDRLLARGRIDLTLLDARVEPGAGEFDAALAALKVRQLPERATPMLLLTDRSFSSEHMAEEVMCILRSSTHRPDLHQLVLGAACDHPDCMIEASLAAAHGEVRPEPHVRDDLLDQRDVLYRELNNRKNAAADIMIATAGRPMPWPEMGRLLNRKPKSLRDSLGTHVAPAAERLGWIEPGASVNQPLLAALVSRRHDYFASYTRRHRPQLEFLFAA